MEQNYKEQQTPWILEDMQYGLTPALMLQLKQQLEARCLQDTTLYRSVVEALAVVGPQSEEDAIFASEVNERAVEEVKKRIEQSPHKTISSHIGEITNRDLFFYFLGKHMGLEMSESAFFAALPLALVQGSLPLPDGQN